MAFDQKLEADRIDDFNLFSAFVRVPFLIIGGILGVDQSKSTCEEIDICTSANHHQDRNSKGDDIDIGIDSTTTRLYPRPQLSNISSNKFCMKKTKKMSWSDENGLPLVLYDESASHHHGSSPYASVTIPRIQKPTKSAIKSSRSIRQEADDLSSSQKSASTALSSSSLSSSSSSSRYIPTMKGKGLTLPTRPYGQSQTTDNQIAGNTNGSEMSPQWGWYINTTPPSPLSSTSTSTSERSSELDAASSKTIVDGNYRCQNQVFQNLKNSNAPIHGWTSIPI